MWSWLTNVDEVIPIIIAKVYAYVEVWLGEEQM